MGIAWWKCLEIARKSYKKTLAPGNRHTSSVTCSEKLAVLEIWFNSTIGKPSPPSWRKELLVELKTDPKDLAVNKVNHPFNIY